MVARRAAPRRRRRWSYVVSALLLGLVGMFAAGEFTLRAFWPPPAAFAAFPRTGMFVAAADGGVAPLPGYRGTLQIGDSVAAAEVELDALGMRGSLARQPAAGERRVLVVGDSLVFGHGVAAAEALPARLEQFLRERGIRGAAGNGGVPGGGVSHAVAHMARLDVPFAADAFVVCGSLGTDAGDDLGPERTAYADLLLSGPIARLVRTSWRARLALRSHAAAWLESWVWANHPDWSPFAQAMAEPELAARVAGMPSAGRGHAGLFLDVIDERAAWTAGASPVVPRLLEALRTSLQRGKEIAKDRPMWFVLLPTLWHVDEALRVAKLKELEFDPVGYERGLAQRRWMQIGKGLGVTVLDSTPILAAEADHVGLFLADGVHLSGHGHDVLARWLAAEMVGRLR